MLPVKPNRFGQHRAYPLGDAIQDREIIPSALDPLNLDKVMAIPTGEFRSPKKGERYLSGSVPAAYIALIDFSNTKYHIARLVVVNKIVIYEVAG